MRRDDALFVAVPAILVLFDESWVFFGNVEEIEGIAVRRRRKEKAWANGNFTAYQQPMQHRRAFIGEVERTVENVVPNIGAGNRKRGMSRPRRVYGLTCRHSFAIESCSRRI